MVYSASNSLIEQEKIWHSDLIEVVKIGMFKKFDSWVETKLNNYYKEKKG